MSRRVLFCCLRSICNMAITLSFRKRDICFVYKVSLSRLWKWYTDFCEYEYSDSIEIEKTVVYHSEKCSVKPNFTKLATLLDMNRNTVSDLMCYLEKAGIINQLRAETEGVRLLGKVDKVYLNITNLSYVLSDNTPDVYWGRFLPFCMQSFFLYNHLIPYWQFFSAYINVQC